MDVTLDDVVIEYLTENQHTMHWYWQSLSYAQAAYEEFRRNYSENFKVGMFNLDSEKKLAFPVGAINFRFIGFRSGDRLMRFMEDKNIATLMKTEGLPNDTFFGTFGNNNYGVTYSTYDAAGVQSSRKYYFRIDWEEKNIVFTQDIIGPVYIEYRTIGQAATDATLIPFYAKEFFKCYIEWMWKKSSKRTGGRASADAQMAEQAWKNELIRYGLSRSNLNKRTILEASNRRLTRWGLGETYYNGTALTQ